MTQNEAMEFAGVGHRKAKVLMKSGDWRAYRNGREIRVITHSIKDWMEREVEKYKKST